MDIFTEMGKCELGLELDKTSTNTIIYFKLEKIIFIHNFNHYALNTPKNGKTMTHEN